MTTPAPPKNLDPRRWPFRDDLAADWLADRVKAPRYAEGSRLRLAVGRTGLWTGPKPTGAVPTHPMASEVVFGEDFIVYDLQDDGWAWGQNATDGYVGWIGSKGLLTPLAEPTHLVTARTTFRFPAPDIKSPPLLSRLYGEGLNLLPMGAQLSVAGQEGRFLALADGGYVFADHTAPLGWKATDPVALALSLVGVPYLWGGRTPLGIDCSGLIQLCLGLCGQPVPRDSDMQREEIGVAVPPDQIQRGDVICFPGHVAFALDAHTVVHATAFTLSVGIEPLAAVAQRADPTRGQGILAVRRPL